MHNFYKLLQHLYLCLLFRSSIVCLYSLYVPCVGRILLVLLLFQRTNLLALLLAYCCAPTTHYTLLLSLARLLLSWSTLSGFLILAPQIVNLAH